MLLKNRTGINPADLENSNQKNLSNKGLRMAVKDGKSQISPIFKGIFHVATLISSFDLKLSFFSDEIKKDSKALNLMASDVSSASEEISSATSQIVNANNDLYNDISEITEEANILNENTVKSNDLLKNIKFQNTCIMNYSKDMENSVQDLLDVISKINKTVKDINKISEQTKLLSLNASIEAARAGTAGKGFAVVASEIRTLSDTTKSLTSDIGALLNEINKASSRSTASVTETVKSIGKVNHNIEMMSDMVNKNSDAIGHITNRLTVVTPTSEEMNSSLQESYTALQSVNSDLQNLSQSAENLKNISNSIDDVSISIGHIENHVNNLAISAGRMVNNKVCGLSNNDFIKMIKDAVKAHTSWVDNLRAMAKSMNLSPIQTNEHKCGFGHFYYAVQPSSEKLLGLWKDVEKLHHDLHKKGDALILDIKQKDPQNALLSVNEAEKISKIIIDIFERMIKIAEEMDLAGESVF